MRGGKTLKKILKIVGIVVFVLVGIFIIVYNILNKEKTPISAERFNTIMEEKGYIMVDTTNQYAQYGNYILKSYLAQKSGYQIEFYELSSEENAIDMYNTNKSLFESQEPNVSASFTISMKNYGTYSLTTNEEYKYLSRIDNTLIYVDVDKNYKDTVKNILKELGY